MSGVWKSQTFDAEGSATASGILRQLGRPDLNEFTILVREAAQNSWDARIGNVDVDFSIRVERLGDRSGAWESLLLPGPSERSVAGFAGALAPDSWAMVVSDRGTQGLAGPIRATERPAEGERNDFVQFLRNVGEPRDTALGGGTYGFGKGIFYRTSSVRTIIADTRIRTHDGYQRRIMGASLGEDFWDEAGTRFTGRHWWGDTSDGIVDPLLDDDAEEAAELLGLPDFGSDRTGTNIVVLGVDLDLVVDGNDDSRGGPPALGNHLASAILWNLWPKFRSSASSEGPAMTFSVDVDGVAVDVPSPIESLTLRPFVDALRSLDSDEGRTYRRVRDPRIHVADLALHSVLVASEEPSVISVAKPFEGPPHHVARVRQAGLVVDYFEGPAHPDPLFAYGGLFRATAEADTHFAAAEPPTHDRWNPEGLERDSKAVVEGARRWLKEELNRRFPTAAPARSDGSAVGLGRGARRLSGLVSGLRSNGAVPGATDRPTGGGGAGGGGIRRPSARIVGEPWIGELEGGLGIYARVKVDTPERISSIRAFLDVVLDGGARETDAPRGEATPQVIGWYAEADNRINESGLALTELRGVSDWILLAEFTDSAITRIRLESEVALDAQ